MAMKHHLFLVIGALALISIQSSYGLGLDLASEDALNQSEDLEGEERLLIPIFLGGSGGGLNLTQFAALAALAAAALLPLLGLAALGLLLWAILSQQSKDSGYGGTGYGAYSSYSSSYRSLDLANTDWEKLSILDWISVAEELYSKYDPSSLECQQKVICELYQNTNMFGPPAHTFIKYFSYLHYAEVLSVPESVKMLSEALLNAAEKGKNLKKDCKDLYEGCEFSIKDIFIKYGHRNLSHNKDNKI